MREELLRAGRHLAVLAWAVTRHLHVAAERDPGDPVLGLAHLDAHEPRPEAEREAQDRHTPHFRRDEMPELVNEDHEAEQQDSGNSAAEQRLHPSDHFMHWWRLRAEGLFGSG